MHTLPVPEAYGPADHALFFAWMARAVVKRAGTARGETLVRKAVRCYGEQRGRRMALRAQAAGRPRTMANFLAYGELSFPADAGEFEEVAQGDNLVERVQRCLWHQAWIAHDLLPYGRLYCQEVDQALVRGFNPELALDVNSTLPNDGKPCEFVFRGALASPAEPAGARKRPWEYHLGHLYATLRRTAVEELGEAGLEAMAEALAEFAARYGEPAAQQVADYACSDFDQP